MGLKIIVLAKQVPDTRVVSKNCMKEDGTVNRSALPAIFNPEDLQALEMALQVKDKIPGSNISVISMGPERAIDIIRDAIFRGADKGILLSDRKFAGSDTLATSYALSMAIKKIGDFDLIFSGRQAIDGDTAQVGPQIAENLHIPQITYAERIVTINNKCINMQRRLSHGIEVVKGKYPILITVTASAPTCRYPIAKRVMMYKNDSTDAITTWNADDIEAEPKRLGLTGSPTKVKNIENVVLAKKESENIEVSESGFHSLISTLIQDHILGS